MIAFTSASPAVRSLRLTALTKFFAAARHEIAVRRTVAALGALTDTELADLGLARWNLRQAAEDAVAGRPR